MVKSFLHLSDVEAAEEPETGDDILSSSSLDQTLENRPLVRRPTAAMVSLILHAVLMTLIALRQLETKRERAEVTPVVPAEHAERVYMPSREELRRMLEPAVPPAPKAPPTPTPPGLKDRISIGPPDTRRAKELELRRDQEIPKTSQGNARPGDEEKLKPKAADRPDASPAAAATAVPTRNASVERSGDEPAADGRLRFPDGRGVSAAPTARPSILGSLHRLEEKWERGAGLGAGTGIGKMGPKQVGPLAFDPEGADFTEWVNHFTRELYRNWVAPQAALMGFKGRVVVQFVVGRDGTIVAQRLVESSGTVSLDHAGEDALRASRLLPLPADFGPATVTMTVIFYYNEGPHPS